MLVALIVVLLGCTIGTVCIPVSDALAIIDLGSRLDVLILILVFFALTVVGLGRRAI